MILQNANLENHPTGTGAINSIVDSNWWVINNWINRASGLTASQTGDSVTASAAVFTSDDVGGYVVWRNGSSALIDSVDSSTVITASTSQTVASGEFFIYKTGQTAYTALARGLTKKLDTTGFLSGHTLVWDGTKFEPLFRPMILFASTSDAAVADTVTETTVLGTGTGSKTLAADILVPGKTLRFRVSGFISDTGTPTLNWKIKFGSTVLCSTGAVALASGLSNSGLCMDVDLTCRTNGVSGTIIGQGIVRVNGVGVHLVSTSAVTVDTTASHVMNVTATWGTANASNTLTVSNATIECLN